MPSPAKTSIRVRMYNVGFGDCFLLTFHCGPTVKDERHILVDFGSTMLPDGAPTSRLLDIAKDIAEQTHGHLTAIVVSHRHADHISGFATKEGGKGPGDIIATLNPDIVMEPWTEHPRAAAKARAPPALGKGLRLHRSSMKAAESFVRALQAFDPARLARQLGRPDLRKALDEAKVLGMENISNANAVRNLLAMAKASRGDYGFAGNPGLLEKFVPGLKVKVLGPPTLEQSEEIHGMTASSPEYWEKPKQALMRLAGSAVGIRASEHEALFPHAETRSLRGLSPDARWVVDRMPDMLLEQYLSIVRVLDDYMNNTSLILLMRFRGKTLLFPGDAQIENWNYSLHNPSLRGAFRAVDIYKVGHHGSLNGTPRSLLDFMTVGRGGQKKLVCMMSTAEGKHGHEKDGTEVPRKMLTGELGKRAVLRSTQDLNGRLFLDETL